MDIFTTLQLIDETFGYELTTTDNKNRWQDFPAQPELTTRWPYTDKIELTGSERQKLTGYFHERTIQ